MEKHDKDEEGEIVNRVAQSNLIVLELDKYYRPNPRKTVDLKDHLYEGLILREKDFREFIRTYNWEIYKDAFVAVLCSADAVIPRWAYMLVMTALAPYASLVVFGSADVLEGEIFRIAMEGESWEKYKNARVLVKGCSKVDVPESVYMDLTRNLIPHVASLMYGEACSTVPVFKRPKSATSADGGDVRKSL